MFFLMQGLGYNFKYLERSQVFFSGPLLGPLMYDILSCGYYITLVVIARTRSFKFVCDTN